MSAIRRSHAEVDMDIALGVLGEFVMGDDQAEEMLSRVQAGVDDGRQQLQGAVSLSGAQWERVLWWLRKPLPPGPAKALDESIIRAINAQRGQ